MSIPPALNTRRRLARSESAFIFALAHALAGTIAALAACTAPAQPGAAIAPGMDVIDRSGLPRPPYEFSAADAEFLGQVQRGAFRFLWEAVDPVTGMVFDRTSVRVISVAGVGFQLGALPVGVERGWITRAEGRERAERILASLEREPANRHSGLFFHYLSEGSAKPTTKGYETVVSTIDSAILLAGMITVSSYFGGSIAERADRLIDAADWHDFVAENPPEEWARGFVTLGWKPTVAGAPGGEGSLLPYYWADAGDEQKLVTFLAVGPSDPAKRVDPGTYYRLRRALGSHADSGPFVWFPWSGALFTHFFAHCWIDYAAIGPDSPGAFGAENRPRVDWWENSRRAAAMHRTRAVENPRRLTGFGENGWGLGANDEAGGYAVRHLYPTSIAWPGAREGRDFAAVKVKDDWGDGTLAPYNAGCAIMFTPRESITALRAYAAARATDGRPLVWRDPVSGGTGFQDSYNPGTGWCAPDCVAIDQGPLLLSIENARSGLPWRLFHQHRVVQESMKRLGLVRVRDHP